MWAAESENKSGEDRCQEAAVHEQVRCMTDESVEEEADDGKADAREDKALTRGECEGELELAQGDTGEEGA